MQVECVLALRIHEPGQGPAHQGLHLDAQHFRYGFIGQQDIVLTVDDEIADRGTVEEVRIALVEGLKLCLRRTQFVVLKLEFFVVDGQLMEQ